MASPYITHSWSAVPGRPQAPPAVTCGPPHYISSCARPPFLIPAVYIPPEVLAYTLQSLLTPYGLLISQPSPAVPSRFLGIIPAVPVGPPDGSEHRLRVKALVAVGRSVVSEMLVCWLIGSNRCQALFLNITFFGHIVRFGKLPL